MARNDRLERIETKPEYAVGDRVIIPLFGRCVVTELRGALGPRGAQVYRLRYRSRPRPGYIEVLGNQMKPAPPKKKSPEAGENVEVPADQPLPAPPKKKARKKPEPTSDATE